MILKGLRFRLVGEVWSPEGREPCEWRRRGNGSGSTQGCPACPSSAQTRNVEAKGGTSPPNPVLLTQLFSQVHHINANYFLDITSMKPEDIENHVFSFSSTFEDPSTATYMQFLKEGLRRGLPLLQP